MLAWTLSGCRWPASWPVETDIALIAGAGLLALAVLAVTFPRGFAYPVAAIITWLAAAPMYRGAILHRERKGAETQGPDRRAAPDCVR